MFNKNESSLNKENINPNNINHLQQIKSKIIFKKIFNNLKEFKSFEILKYNKKYLDLIHLNIKDINKYCDIEIEIIPIKNKRGDFINILNEDEAKYFHIYFNKDKKEVKKNYLTGKENIDIINIVINYQIKSFYELFQYCECIEYINFKKFNRNKIYDMSYMFNGCTSLKKINFSNFRTSDVIKMNHMFYGCTSLEKISLINFCTNKVRDMSYMFYGCSLLTEIDISNFNVNNVINMDKMFYDCSLLKEIKFCKINNNFVKNMNYMFYGCSKLNEKNIKDLFLVDEKFSKTENELKQISIQSEKENVKN